MSFLKNIWVIHRDDASNSPLDYEPLAPVLLEINIPRNSGCHPFKPVIDHNTAKSADQDFDMHSAAAVFGNEGTR